MTNAPIKHEAIQAASRIEDAILTLECFVEAIGDANESHPPAWLHLALKLTQELRDRFNENMPVALGTTTRAGAVTPHPNDPQRVAEMDAYATARDAA